MTTTSTTNFGFIACREETPSVYDWSPTYWNWLALDSILFGAAVSHVHDGALAIDSPEGTIVLSSSPTGGTVVAGTYYFCVTYIDSRGLESAKSEVVSITVPPSISPPATPTINDDATPTDIQAKESGLLGGNYWYRISYVKNGGETTPSSPVYVQIPIDDTYECTIHFDSINTVGNSADSIYVYRKTGNTGSYVHLATISTPDTDSYTDDNSDTPICDKSVATINTTGSYNTITIDWSALNYTLADYVRIYVTTNTDDSATPVADWTATSLLVSTVTMNDATPVEEYTWTGGNLSIGKPPIISGCYQNPSKILLTGGAEIQGNLPWANLPSDFTWGQPVAEYDDLPTGIAGEVILVKSEDILYTWDDGAATPTWIPVTGGIKHVTLPDDLGYQADSNFDTTVLPLLPEDPNTGDVVILTSEERTGGDFDYVVYLYTWRGDWDTPAWQLINPTLPSAPYGFSYGTDSAPTATMWLQENDEGDYWIRIKQSWGYYDMLPVDWEYIGDESGYYGPWEETYLENLGEPTYGEGSIIFLLDDQSFYYWDDEIATPAWVKGPGVVKQDTTIDDVVEDATPTAEQLKINEILEVLRASGLIASE